MLFHSIVKSTINTPYEDESKREGTRIKNALCKEHECERELLPCRTLRHENVRGQGHPSPQPLTRRSKLLPCFFSLHLAPKSTGSDACTNDMSAGAMSSVTKQQGFGTIEISHDLKLHFCASPDNQNWGRNAFLIAVSLSYISSPHFMKANETFPKILQKRGTA
jgi:hypothetical protein